MSNFVNGLWFSAFRGVFLKHSRRQLGLIGISQNFLGQKAHIRAVCGALDFKKTHQAFLKPSRPKIQDFGPSNEKKGS